MENSKKIIKVAIADDHKIFRDGIKLPLSSKSDIEILWEAEDGKDMMQKIAIRKPEIILMDIRMPEIDGIEGLQLIRKKYEDIKVIVLTMYDDPKMITTMMELGANAYLTKTTDPEEIYEAIATCMADEFYFNDLVNNAVLNKLEAKKTKNSPSNSKNSANLNEKELKILQLIGESRSIEEISKVIFLSPRTINAILQNIKIKVSVKSTKELFKYATRMGILTNSQNTESERTPFNALSTEQMEYLFRISISILKYVTHDLSNQQSFLQYHLRDIKEHISPNNEKQSGNINFIEINSKIDAALKNTSGIGSIIDLMNSHFYLKDSLVGTSSNGLFITKPIEIVKIIQDRYKEVNIEIHGDTTDSLEIIYPPNIFLAIISELIENAKKITPSNLSMIIIWKMQGHIFQCEVHDNGRGFLGVPIKGFIPYQSILSTQAKIGKGRGLGIIERTIIDSNGHLFFSKSHLLNGALIYFEFPVINFRYKTTVKNGKK